MAQDNQQQDKNNPLNDAVEHNATPDGNTDEHRAQDRQNQQNTMAATTATGADAAEQNDQVNNNSPESNQGNNEDAGGHLGAEASDTGGNNGSHKHSGNSDSSAQGGEALQDDGNVEDGGAPQSVGGDAQPRSQSPLDGEGQNRGSQQPNEQSSQDQLTGSSDPTASGQSVEPTVFDTETSSETFQVDVADATTKELVGDGDFDTETVSETFEIQVDNVNDDVEIDTTAPLQFGTQEDTDIVITEAELLANASDVDGDELSVINLNIAGASYTTQVDPETGERSFVITPDQDVNGDLSVTFDVTDGQGSQVASGATLQVAAVNDAVVAEDDSSLPGSDAPSIATFSAVAEPSAIEVEEDGQLIISPSDLLANDTDVDGDELTITGVEATDDTHGTVELDENGNVVFTPDADYNGPASFTYTVTDGNGSFDTATVSVNVTAQNDAAVVSETNIDGTEDTAITFTQAMLLQNASDVDSSDLTAVNLQIDPQYGTLEDNQDGTFTFTPKADLNGDVPFTFDVDDNDGAVTPASGTLDVEAVNDVPLVSENLTYTIDEDGTITLSQDQLLANATDVDGDKLTAENLQLEGAGDVERNDDGSYTITPDENFNGELNLTFDVTDGLETVSTGLDLTINAVNDEVVAADDSSMSAQAPQIRLDAAPEHGSVQCINAEGEWEDMVVGQEYPADAQVQFVPDTEEVQSGTRDIRVGSFDSDTSTSVFDGTAKVEDWGTVDGNTAIYQEDGVTITTEVNSGDLAAWNGAGSQIGAGIGNNTRNGLSDDEYLTVTVEGEDVNQITFQLDGLGGYFDESSSKATEVIIQAYDAEGNLIDSQGGFRESGELQDTYAFTTDVPVHHFTLGTEGGKGTYVVQNMTVSRTMSEDIQMTTIQGDGSEIINTLSLDLNHSTADQAMDVTEQLVEVQEGITSRAIEVDEDGQLVINPADLLVNDTDADGDILSITAVEATEDTHGTVELDEDGNVVFTPDVDYNGPASFTYTVTDGNGSFDTATVAVDVKPVEDLPVAPTLKLDVDEDQVLEIDPAFILSQATDADGDDLTLESLSLKQPPNGNLQLQQDGMYHLITPPDFNGLIELDYSISDGENIVDGALKVDVMPVNDAPFNGGNAHLTTYEDGGFTFRAEDMLDLFGDVDGDELVVSRVITVDGEDAGEVEQNEDGSWTYTPSDNYAGTAELQIEVSDPSGATTVLDMPVYIRPVADGAVITTDHEGPLVFDEDTTGLLGLNVDMLDASEQLSHLVITGFPVGFVVTDGENTITITEPGQVVDVTTWSFDDLSLTPPADFTGSFFITVSATTADYGDESSNTLPESTEAYADFDATQGETLVLTMEDLLGMAEGLEAADGDEVQGVHLIDRSQGELVDNGDGTWSFTPAESFEGQVDFAYQVEHNGSLVDVQSSIAVVAAETGANADNSAPTVDAIVTTELGAGNDLAFSDTDMLAQLTDADNDDLTIESVQLVGGQGVLETNSEGQYTFSPAEGFAGQAQIAFVATDGENSIQTHFNVNVAEPEASDFTLNEMGSLDLTQDDLLAALNLGDESTITAVDYHGEQGTVIEEGDGWVFWSDDDFTGQLPLEVTSIDGNATSVHQITLDVNEYQDLEASSKSAKLDGDSQQHVDTQTTINEDASDNSDSSDSDDAGGESDLTAAPGNNVHFEIPDDVAENPDVTQVEISELPDGATIANALLNSDGSYTVSGNLSKPLLMKLSDEFEGEATIQFEGQTDLGAVVEGASATVTIDVDDEHAMQGNQGKNANQPAMQDENGQNDDWTQGDNSNQGVDVMDDSSSYDNDSSGSQQDDTPIMDENM